MKKVSMLIPVYNEKKFLLDIVKLCEEVDFGCEKEIILIDDFSTDGTRELYKDLPHKVLYHEKNKGKGAAIRTGIEQASGDIILIQDSDLEFNPADYKPIVEMLAADKADVVYGSRFADNRNKGNFLFLSYVANTVLSLLTRLLYGTYITDSYTCYKAFKADVIKNIKLECNRFEFEAEVTAKVLRNKTLRYSEVPISYNARTEADGKKITWKDGIIAICTLFKYRFVD